MIIHSHCGPTCAFFCVLFSAESRRKKKKKYLSIVIAQKREEMVTTQTTNMFNQNSRPQDTNLLLLQMGIPSLSAVLRSVLAPLLNLSDFPAPPQNF